MIYLFVTGHCEGDLGYLPRLHTALQQRITQLGSKAYRIDAGRAWSAASWICQATENRAPYIILDAMGFDIAFADGLRADGFEKLEDQLMMRLADPNQLAQLETPIAELLLRVDESSVQAQISDGVLSLPIPAFGQILQLGFVGATIQQQDILTVEPSTLPDATIAGTIEFVMSEARYYQKNQS